MGLLSKLKGVFYDEYEEEAPQEIQNVTPVNKVEKRQENDVPKIEEIKVPVKEEKVVEPVKEERTYNDKDLFRGDRTFSSFNFTQFDDEEVVEPPKKSNNVLENREVRTKIVEEAKPAEPKVFKPTPVISPIYGILDKDYKKEEIISKTLPKSEESTSAKITTYDKVRRKAYGTLEDELEDTLNSMNSISTATINKEMNKSEKNVNTLEEKANKIESLINKIDEVSDDIDKSMSVGELEDSVHIDNFDDDKDEEEDDKTISSSTLEHDLFSLIDSMYDDKEE